VISPTTGRRHDSCFVDAVISDICLRLSLLAFSPEQQSNAGLPEWRRSGSLDRASQSSASTRPLAGDLASRWTDACAVSAQGRGATRATEVPVVS
jgi:hypothetical protein